MDAPQQDQQQREKRPRKSKALKKLNEAAAMAASLTDIADKKARTLLRKTEKKYTDAVQRATQSELLLTEEAGYIEAEGMERTYKFSQTAIKQNVDVNTQNKAFDLKLNEFGPYALDYTRNGKFLLVGGRKGHVATFDWKSKKLGCELHLKETVRDVQWLHNETMFAVAQKINTYIYDQTGMEIHCLKKFVEINKLQFLPYHFLLAGVGKSGFLRYQDTSTGQIVAEHRTKLGDCNVMAQNPYNAIINLGHANGTVTLWSPSMSEPLVKMLCHKGPVKAVAVDNGGYYMATSGLDGQLKVWDIRSYKPVHEYYTPTPASELTIIGHAQGINSMIVPGSGEPNYDAFEANPYQTKEQRKRREVLSLLDKIQPEMITLNPDFIGAMDRTSSDVKAEERRMEFEANNPEEKFVPRNRARGKSASMRRYLRKQANVVDPNRLK
ncbi:hypothetical protein CcCBS67573_g10639, partial [Chytriomyces confervae]